MQDALLQAYRADKLRERLSGEAKSKVKAVSGDAETTLRAQLLDHFRSPRSEELRSAHYRNVYQQLIPFFEDYALSVFDAHAEELIGLFSEKNEYVRVLRDEVTAKIANWIWPRGPHSRFSPDEVRQLRGVVDPDIYDFALSGLWERVLDACWNTISANKRLSDTDFEEWKWRIVYALRYDDIHDHFPHLLRTRLEHQLPRWEAGFESSKLRGSRSLDENESSPQHKPHPSEFISTFLLRNGWTRSRLAAEAGIARNTLQRIIDGKKTQAKSISAVAEVLDCDYKRLLPPKRLSHS